MPRHCCQSSESGYQQSRVAPQRRHDRAEVRVTGRSSVRVKGRRSVRVTGRRSVRVTGRRSVRSKTCRRDQPASERLRQAKTAAVSLSLSLSLSLSRSLSLSPLSLSLSLSLEPAAGADRCGGAAGRGRVRPVARWKAATAAARSTLPPSCFVSDSILRGGRQANSKSLRL